MITDNEIYNFLINPNPSTPSNFTHPQAPKFSANKPSYDICQLGILDRIQVDNKTNLLKFNPESFKTLKKMIYSEGFRFNSF